MGPAAITSNRPVVRLTARAAEQVKAMLSNQAEPEGLSFRVYVEAGGCLGLQYGMILDQPREGDIRNDAFGATILVDSASAQFLQGTVVDYLDNPNDGGFKISNPAARQGCGCGRSFEA